jgi:hypothetical protein
MEQRVADLEGRQVKCLTADAGHVWMPDYDRLPSQVRARLANSIHNICPACMDIAAHELAARCGERKPSLATYFTTIQAIERQLESNGGEHNGL